MTTSTSEETKYVLCHDCATAVVNDDSSALTDDHAQRVAEFCEEVGWLSLVSDTEADADWCECCDTDLYGGGVVLSDC